MFALNILFSESGLSFALPQGGPVQVRIETDNIKVVKSAISQSAFTIVLRTSILDHKIAQRLNLLNNTNLYQQLTILRIVRAQF